SLEPVRGGSAMRDIQADWKLWSRGERILASMLVAAWTMGVPMLSLMHSPGLPSAVGARDGGSSTSTGDHYPIRGDLDTVDQQAGRRQRLKAIADHQRAPLSG